MPANPPASRVAVDRETIDWLLEKDQPAARYGALVDLLGRKETDPDVRATRRRLARVGWAHEQLRRQGPEGFWERRGPKGVRAYVNFLYYPNYTATNWRALVLADLGLDSTHPQIRKLADVIFSYKLRLSSPFNFFHEEACIVGNTARMLTRFGYADDPRVRRLYDWMLDDQRDDGGWNCSQGTPGTLDAWEPLAAFASLPKPKRSPRMEAAIARGAEFYLERRLFREGRPYAPWLRLHYPNHYFYDILVGLDVLTRLGYAGDRRLRPALAQLLRQRHRDGTWHMDRLHPDIGPGGGDRPKSRPLVIERPGRPSKWITLKALRVVRAVDAAS